MQNHNQFNNFNLLKTTLQWWRPLLIVFVAAVALSALLSSPLFIKPKFKSYAIVYPSNIIPYSTESQTEQMLQIFKSDDIRDSIIDFFNLAEHYHISPSSKHYYSSIIRKYNRSVRIRKTEFESVRIEVLSHDAEKASAITKKIIKLFNRKVRQMHREKAKEVLIIAQKQMQNKQKQIDSVSSLINAMGAEHNILNFEAQVKEVTRGYLGTVDGAGAARINKQAVIQMKENLEQHGAQFMLLNNVLEGLIKQYIEHKNDYETALRDVEKQLTYTNIVSSPFPADRKSYPIRWLIVFIATLSALFIAVLIIVFIEHSKKSNIERIH